MSEKRQIEIFDVEDDGPAPNDERTVAAFDSFVEQWVEAFYLRGNWFDAEGVIYAHGQITKWFDFPVEVLDSQVIV